MATAARGPLERPGWPGVVEHVAPFLAAAGCVEEALELARRYFAHPPAPHASDERFTRFLFLPPAWLLRAHPGIPSLPRATGLQR